MRCFKTCIPSDLLGSEYWEPDVVANAGIAIGEVAAVVAVVGTTTRKE